MNKIAHIIDKILLYISIAAGVLFLILIGYFWYELEHPILCKYKYKVANLEKVSNSCRVSTTGNNYCKNENKEVIRVDSFEKFCERS